MKHATNTTPILTLKNYKRFNGHDGNGFEATLYVNGKRRCIVSDDGWGGGYMYSEDVADLEKWAATLPAIEYDGHKLNMDLDLFISQLVDAIEVEMAKNSWAKKLQKMQVKNILLGVPGADSYRTFKSTCNISDWAAAELQPHINMIKGLAQPGEVILNTNLPGGIVI